MTKELARATFTLDTSPLATGSGGETKASPPCPSTHGAAGYAPGSRWKGDKIVCGICGIEIDNPRPSGSRDGKPTWSAAVAGSPPKDMKKR
jgi:hypothetical protein